MRMFLKRKDDIKTHISHFHHYVSSYETNEETVRWLEDLLVQGANEAKEKGESVIVDQDSMEHIFVCHPAGNVTLYREVGTFEVTLED